jgi:hypothetical protein
VILIIIEVGHPAMATGTSSEMIVKWMEWIAPTTGAEQGFWLYNDIT